MKKVLLAVFAFLFYCNISAAQDGGELGKLVSSAINSRPNLTSMKARTAMRIIDSPSKFTLGVNTITIAQDPTNLRIQASKLAGRIKAFDAAIYNDKINFYLPRNNLIFSGTTKEMKESTNIAFYPDEILGHLIRTEVNLLNRLWKKINEDRRELVLEEQHDKGSMFYRLKIDPSRTLINEIEFVNPENEVVFRKTFKKYKLVKIPMANGSIAEKYFAYWFKVDWPKAQHSIAIAFKRVEFNPSVKPSDFEVEVFDSGKLVIKKLGELTKDDSVAKSLSDEK